MEAMTSRISKLGFCVIIGDLPIRIACMFRREIHIRFPGSNWKRMVAKPHPSLSESAKGDDEEPPTALLNSACSDT